MYLIDSYNHSAIDSSHRMVIDYMTSVVVDWESFECSRTR